jgi:hypothetical protein
MEDAIMILRGMPTVRAWFGPAALSVLCLVAHHSLSAQSFTKITNPTNPVATDDNITAYTGAAWDDVDGDGLLDLLIVDFGQSYLYRNHGNDSFSVYPGNPFASDNSNYRGVTFGDFDNDGDRDVFVAGSNRGSLYRNDSGSFVRVDDTLLGTTDTRGWSPAWGDYNLDGNLDLFITFPNGFVSNPNRPNRLLLNNGPPDYTFTFIDTGIMVTQLYPFTSGNWSDFDMDGDLDMFVGCGPASNFVAVDYLYRNLLMDSGYVAFKKITDAPLATDAADGQVWNLIDYDNDGDFDAHRTNWGGGGVSAVQRRNDLYENTGGTYVGITTGSIVTDQFVSLSALWEDFDNDADLDCYVANVSGVDNFYRNDGGGTFTSIVAGDIGVISQHTGATAGDYDNDGDQDIFAVGHGSGQRSLWRNDTNNGNAWLKITLEGTESNRDGIGARVYMWSMINGSPVQQIREVSAQNSFLGHSSLIVHFGLKDASMVDSIRVFWPSGAITDTENVAGNQLLILAEVCGDPDADGIDCLDNCPDSSNTDQADADGDGTGDVCDICPTDPDNDIDSDSWCADQDNCPTVSNFDQVDTDSNGVGDACCCLDRGNVDGIIGPGGPVDVSDLTFLVAYLFQGGTQPPCPEQGNTDSIVGPGGLIDVSDLTFLVSFLFQAGPAPAPCS